MVARFWRLLTLATAILVAAGLLAARWASQSAPQIALKPGRFNVVLISLDTTRADHLSCYGYDRPTTPHLDSLADEGLLFEHCVAVSNYTLPTHASMLTGLYAEAHGARLLLPEECGNFDPGAPGGVLADACITLAEALSQHGYRTGAVLANHGFLHPRYQLDQGFDHYDARAGSVHYAYRPAAEITQEAIAWLQRAPDRPFFLFLNYMDPHHPYNPPPPYAQRFVGGDSEAWQPRSEAYFREIIVDVTLKGKSIPDELAQWLTDRYDGELAYMDAAVGRLIQWLREQGLYEKTIFLVTSDHGEALGEHSVRGHGFRLYEPELAVPMILKLPGQGHRGKRRDRVSHVDCTPTILECLGIEMDVPFHGRSMLHVDLRDVFATKHPDVKMSEARVPLDQIQRAIYRGSLKYLEYSDAPPELYDLQRDPYEQRNLASSRPDDVAALSEALRIWIDRIKPLEPPRLAFPSFDPVQLNNLRTLGYAQ